MGERSECGLEAALYFRSRICARHDPYVAVSDQSADLSVRSQTLFASNPESRTDVQQYIPFSNSDRSSAIFGRITVLNPSTSDITTFGGWLRECTWGCRSARHRVGARHDPYGDGGSP